MIAPRIIDLVKVASGNKIISSDLVQVGIPDLPRKAPKTANSSGGFMCQYFVRRYWQVHLGIGIEGTNDIRRCPEEHA